MTNDEMIERINELVLRVELLEQGKRIPFERAAGPRDKHWPAWRYPPHGGEGKIFESKALVPKGWLDAPYAEPAKEEAA